MPLEVFRRSPVGGVILETRVVDPVDIKRAFRSLSQKLGYDKNLYDKMAEKYAANPKQSPVHRILINIAGGKGSS